MSNQPAKIWSSGPKELLYHAFEHMAKGQPFDFRIAMISIDNAVELAIKTYLTLPKRARGTEGPTLKRFQEASNSFSHLINLLEEYAKHKLSGIDLGEIEVYHRSRNTLYHDGNVTIVDPSYVDDTFKSRRYYLVGYLMFLLKQIEQIRLRVWLEI